MTVSKYISNMLVGYSSGVLAKRWAKKYFVKNYGFTEEDFKLIENGWWE